jgi:hypothetical protein
MKVAHIVCAMLACVPLSFEARATASSEDGRPSVAAAKVDEAARRTVPGRAGSAEPQGTRDRESTQARARTGGGSKGRDSAVAVSPHGRLARQPNRPVGSIRAATAGPAVRGPQGVRPASQPKLAAATSAASPAARLAVTPRNSTIGGPHPQGFGRVGGPAIGRATHGATIDGGQMHPKF